MPSTDSGEKQERRDVSKAWGGVRVDGAAGRARGADRGVVNWGSAGFRRSLHASSSKGSED